MAIISAFQAEDGGSIPPTRSFQQIAFLKVQFYITKIESGATPNLTIETMAKIAKGLGVSIDDLIK